MIIEVKFSSNFHFCIENIIAYFIIGSQKSPISYLIASVFQITEFFLIIFDS